MLLLVHIFFKQHRNLILYFTLLSFFCFGIYTIFSFKTHGIHVLPINFSHFPDKPLLNAYVEGKKVSLLIDIGSYSELGLQTSILNRIANKKFIKTTENMDAKGDTYLLQTFLIPSIFIGNIKAEQLSVQEEDLHSFINSGLLWSDFQAEERKQKKIKCIQGKIGRAFFSQWACLFDCPNSKLLLAKNAKRLLALYSSKKFIKVPFISSKYGILVSLDTALGTKSFLLDTGANVSLLRESQIDKKLAQEIRPNRWEYTTNTLKWNDYELGKESFWLYEFCPEITFDGVLGIDFFKTHIVLIDFENHLLYISNCFN
jgi:hypothetical protein